MSDPTPDLRALRVLSEAYAGVDRLAADAAENLRQAIALQIRAAVLAERKACVCVAVDYGDEGIAAAIRARKP